ncbi:hydrogenase maturation nickel metallochaperone HypA [Helicobacter canadensis]|uniref:Hydrogenase maturation factor HypA n=1 Tax=Helicobacter canadensis MIT 98-5491 TaxID=537970 RepID=C5ZX15_9HELI|nr:hydrogenase maturation nickel metallochaperone HypA [Helicobacter canadensis]EES89683.1 hydrogenase nickel insertion protein HypA [Helicobacter canadensis MIT 98-5491]EFR48475.1 putative hydrogenase nickel insertion protein HypA [Helicobacter canadensis MIT 98-5491]STO99719.1 hydrogenase nickel incorporation protein [Helicobacter canadensis]
MHEFSIVASLIENCERIAKENNAESIFEIYLEIGRRSGVNAALLQRAFEEFKVGSMCDGAKLFIEDVEVEVFCEFCKKQSQVVEICYTKCPLCQNEGVKIVKGTEMLIKRLVME